MYMKSYIYFNANLWNSVIIDKNQLKCLPCLLHVFCGYFDRNILTTSNLTKSLSKCFICFRTKIAEMRSNRCVHKTRVCLYFPQRVWGKIPRLFLLSSRREIRWCHKIKMYVYHKIRIGCHKIESVLVTN